MAGAGGLPLLGLGMKRGAVHIDSQIKASIKSNGKKARGLTGDWVRDAMEKTGEEAVEGHATCKHCHTHLSQLNISRIRDHLLNPKVCSYLTTPEAQDNKNAKVVEALAARAGPSSRATQGKLTGSRSSKGGIDSASNEGERFKNFYTLQSHFTYR